MLDQMLRGFQTDKTVRVHFPLRRYLAQQRQPAFAQTRHGRQADRVSHGILDPEKMQKQFFGYDITDSDRQVLRQTGNMGHPATVTNRAGEQVEALVSRNLKTNELVAFPLSKVISPAEKNGHTFHPGRDSPAQTGRGGGLPVPFPEPRRGAAQGLPGSRAGRRDQDPARISLRRPGQAGDGCVQGEPETDRQSGGAEDFPQAGAYREVRLELEAGGTVKVSGLVDERKSLPRLHHMEARREARLHVPQGLQGGARRGACQARRGAPRCRWRSIPRASPLETTRNLKEALQSAQQGRPTGERKRRRERRQEQKEDRKQAQKRSSPTTRKTRPGVSAADFPRHSVNELPVIPSEFGGITFVKPLNF